MGKCTEIIKQLLVRFKQKDFEFIVDNWSVFSSSSFDVPDLGGRAKAKIVTALIERMKVITCIIVHYMYNLPSSQKPPE